jgi:hypothetical protein
VHSISTIDPRFVAKATPSPRPRWAARFRSNGGQITDRRLFWRGRGGPATAVNPRALSRGRFAPSDHFRGRPDRALSDRWGARPGAPPGDNGRLPRLARVTHCSHACRAGRMRTDPTEARQALASAFSPPWGSQRQFTSPVRGDKMAVRTHKGVDGGRRGGKIFDRVQRGKRVA